MPPDEKDLSHLLDHSDVLPSNATLRSIVARSQRYRERRLKVVTATAIVLMLASVSFAGITGANSGTNSASGSPAKKNASADRNFSLPAALRGPSNTVLSAQRRRDSVGRRASEANSRAASPTAGSASSKSSAAVPAFCTVDGCPGYLPTPSGPLTRLFIRTVGDVTVRAFTEPMNTTQPEPLISSPGSVPSGSTTVPSSSSTTTTAPNSSTGSGEGSTGTALPPIESCESTESLVVEVSNPGAIGEVTVALPGIVVSSVDQPFDLIESAAVGVAESSPIEVLAVYVSPNVNSVQASFADGSSDQMTVNDGWAVLVDDGSAPLPATLTALDASGNAIGKASVSSDEAIAEPAECLSPFAVEPSAPVGGASGTTSK